MSSEQPEQNEQPTTPFGPLNSQVPSSEQPTAEQPTAEQPAWVPPQQAWYLYPPQAPQSGYGQPQYGQPSYVQWPYAQTPYAPQPQPRRRRGLRLALTTVGACAILVGAGAVGYAISDHSVSGSPAAATAPAQPSTGTGGSGGSTGGSGGSTNPFGGGTGSGSNGFGYGSGGYGGFDPFGGNTQLPNTDSNAQATSTQQVGVVDIDTVLQYQDAEAAGTGMVLTSNGEILTNNHVINGATSISVTVVSTGKKYTATVVGTDPTQDVAVLQLQNASGLATAKIGDSSGVKSGASVTAVGNAGGVGGTPSAAAGKIVALNQTITATDDDGSNPETLSGLFETDAGIEAGDSGGPLYNSNGQIIGMDTAAQTSRDGSTVVGYAIPIDTAEKFASEIEAGQSSSTVHIGLPAFLGVSIDTQVQNSSGAVIDTVLPNLPAQKAGMTAGDTITAINSTKVTNATSLQTALRQDKPGDSVSVTWVDSSGASHHATVTLVAGPAD